MKALSLWQPWATLVISGQKTYETRSWPTAYRGPLLIHAAQHFPADVLELCKMEPFRSALCEAGCKDPRHLPRGCVLGAVMLRDCQGVDKVLSLLEEPERSFGDYRDGRYAWELSHATPLAVPVRYRGLQGLFNVDEDLLPGEFLKGMAIFEDLSNRY